MSYPTNIACKRVHWLYSSVFRTDRMEFEPGSVDNTYLYRTLTTAIVPRPIAWVSSVGGTGSVNLAPFSFFNIVSDSEPPVVMFSPGLHAGDLKDTTRNIAETEEFVVNIVPYELITQMDKTSERVGPSVNEFVHADVESTSSNRVAPPRVSDSPVSLECELRDSEEIGEHTMILGEVIYVHVDDAVITDGKIDPEKIQPVGRIGGSFYTRIDRLALSSNTIENKLEGDN